MKINPDFVINELESNSLVFEGLLSNIEPPQALWQPAPDKWCLLEIICHLVDEEIHDFRKRVRTALEPERYPFESIDPVGWVTAKKYINQDYDLKVREWIKERQDSIAFLRGLVQPDWNSTLIHPDLGTMSAGLFLSNWLAHDYIHIRQINRTKRAYLNHIAGESLDYAGTW